MLIKKNPEVGDEAEKDDSIGQKPAKIQLETPNSLPIKQLNYSAEELRSFPEMANDDCNWSYRNNSASIPGCAAAKDQGVSHALPGSHWCQ